MSSAIRNLIASARQKRWLHLCVVNLRIVVGFAFVPAGLKKVLYQPFTDPTNTGVFHEFLHGFYATGAFYQFVGVMQLCAAALLMTQRFAAVGAALALPIATAIMVFCWSTAVYPTAVVVTLIVLALVGLLVWDAHRWRAMFAPDGAAAVDEPPLAPVQARLWQWCGAAILVLYLAVCAFSGGIYRPRGMELDNPAFYIFPAITVLPIAALLIDRRRTKAAPPAGSAGRPR